jgi:phytoene synthase
MKPSLKTTESEKVMAKYGKTFYFASRFFKAEMRIKIFHLYSFCRYVDDCADELSKEESHVALNEISSHLDGKSNQNTELSSMIKSLNTYGVTNRQMSILLEGAFFDLRGEHIHFKSDLIKYCYRVAGVVGLMVCPILKVQKDEASYYAVDLGIAMQITNICRDVLEDAKNNRLYLPENELNKYGLSLDHLKKNLKTPDALKDLVKKYIITADQYYESAYSGLSYIPFRPRLVILIAGEMYRAIGKKIAKQGYNVLSGRVYLSKGEKIRVALKALTRVFTRSFWSASSHTESYHEDLNGFPGVHFSKEVKA